MCLACYNPVPPDPKEDEKEDVKRRDRGGVLQDITASSSQLARPVAQLHQPWGKDGYVTKGQLGTHKGTTMKLLQNKKTRELVAAKFIPRIQGAGLHKETEREIVNHRKLLHPNIIGFREVYMTDEHLVIVMEYASGGALQERVSTSGRIPEQEAKKLFRQLVDGMAYCHAQKIYHRDLRMDNLLLHGNHFKSTLKLSNFGYSKSSVLDSMCDTASFGNPPYTPPELLVMADGTGYDGAAVDVWASGIILYCMLTAKLPFLDGGAKAINSRVMQRIMKGRYDLPKDLDISPECQHLVARILTPSAAKRITAEEIKKHPWLSGVPLPAQSSAATLQPALQSEDSIKEVVQRARERRRLVEARNSVPKQAARAENVNGDFGAVPLELFQHSPFLSTR